MDTPAHAAYGGRKGFFQKGYIREGKVFIV